MTPELQPEETNSTMAFSFQSGARALRSTDLGLRILFTSDHKGAMRPDKFFKFFLWCQTFFFLLVVVPTDFRQCLQILCGFQKVHIFPAGLGLSAFQVRADFAQMSNFLRFTVLFFATNASRLLPFRSLIVLSIFYFAGFHFGFEGSIFIG